MIRIRFFNLRSPIFWGCLLVFPLGCKGYSSRLVPQESNPIHVSGRTIEIQPDSKFVNQLVLASVGPTPGGERKLRTVGQMIAMVNSSGALTGPKRSWVTLDPALIDSLGLRLKDDAPAGSAYGVTSVSASYLEQIHPGEKVEIYRYGLRQNGAVGTVISVTKIPDSESGISIVFSILRGEDWYPGVNCQIEFPLIHRQAFEVSPLAMLHEGLHEYILKQISPNHYQPIEITVVSETAEHVYALGDLAVGDRVVERGAILLKPLVRQILNPNTGRPHDVR